ncbi:hypothetical protein [Cylindrospermopsis raciborskii]|uniref:hypothetical protein n=1 Tax=Cylindrospermopsis raciborskii TaxID=77022 RepID=UPI00128F4008|nr:hypothetical protein [Cylindrospermopsis raciborskii]MCZ2202030.1 hypothetical protein [Cylindrospermopsis raciborskii PAMP2012]MCZ2207080.1 hypothetical protein [Cylindrospermopsis raciborskii PAMP2011]
MKYVLILTTLSGLGCAFSFYPSTQTLAGSVPVGAVSGVTLPSSLGTSNISPVLPTASISPPTVPISTPSVVTSTSSASPTEVSAEKTTPIIPVVNPGSQMVLNQTATQTLTELQIIAPTVAGTITSNVYTPPVTLTSPVSQITITPSAAFTLPSLTTATESVPKDLPMGTPSSPIGEVTLAVTPLQAGQTIASQVVSGRGAEMTINTSALRIAPISQNADNKEVSTTATLTIANSQNLNLVLTGTSERVANAAGFIGTATSAGLSLNQIQTGTSIALTGANFGQVASLINSLSGLMVTGTNQAMKPDQSITLVKHGPVKDVTIEPVQLGRAIVVFNQILDTSNDDTVIALSENTEFLTIGKMLQRLRSAFDD